jgi:hypothetical protein
MTLPFRSQYLDYDALTALVHSWAKDYPAIVRLESIGATEEGRSLWLLTLGANPELEQPSVWIDGNMHATELAGSCAALEIAWRKIQLHEDPTAEPSLPAHIRESLRRTRFFVLPRICPDGAETVLKTGRYVRSNPRDNKPDAKTARWKAQDLDGDGLSLNMRVESETGEFVESKAVPGYLVPRELEDEGPFYKVYPEGIIENFTGEVPTSTLFDGNDVDLNRNFPHTWYAEPKQAGAGRYPMSEPESRAVVEFTTKHPSIVAWLNFHTFGGVFIRPHGSKPDAKMDQEDLAVFRYVGEFSERLTGYPMVSGYEDFLYEPDTPLYGDLTDYAYHQRGTLAYVCELWDLFVQLEMPRKKPFSDVYEHFSRVQWENFARWDKDKNQSRVVRPWKRVQHPQLGPVDVGGLDPRVGISNPPHEHIADMCEKQWLAFARVAAMVPDVRVKSELSRVGEITTVTVRVTNHGYLPTYVLNSAKELNHAAPLWLEAEVQGCTLLDPSQKRVELGHLEGYGRGLNAHSVFLMRGKGSVSDAHVRISVRGKGTLALRVGCHRTGFQTHTVAIA